MTAEPLSTAVDKAVDNDTCVTRRSSAGPLDTPGATPARYRYLVAVYNPPRIIPKPIIRYHWLRPPGTAPR